MKAVVLGGTQGMGRAVARILAERGDAVFLLGRNEEELRRSAADLSIRGNPPNSAVGFAVCDLEKPETLEAALAQADQSLQKFDTVVVSAALFAPQDQLEADEEKLLRLLQTNFSHTILFCEKAKKRLLSRGGGNLCVFSSVAGDRGRKPVVLYGSTKAGLSAYLEGLDHKHRADGLKTLCVKPGFVKTSMTAGLPTPPFSGTPEEVAKQVVAALDRGVPLLYTPAMWRWVMAVIRRLPRFVMRRIQF